MLYIKKKKTSKNKKNVDVMMTKWFGHDYNCFDKTKMSQEH